MDDDLFLPGVPAHLIEAAYLNAPGNEIESGKFAHPESSAALVANAFGLFLNAPTSLPPLPGTIDFGWPAESVTLEAIVRFPWSGGRHPCLDVLIVTKTALIGVESKRFEPFRSKSCAAMSNAYWRDVWGSEMAGYKACRDSLRDGRRFHRLDAMQLVKHAFGLRTVVHSNPRWHSKRPILYYLYAEPDHWPSSEHPISDGDRTQHRDEMNEFSKMTDGNEVLFCSCSYSELLRQWSARPNGLFKAHAAAIATKYHP